MTSTYTWATTLFLLVMVASMPAVAGAQTAGLTLDALKNATYPSEFSPSKQVTLLDGKAAWNQPPLRGNAVFVDAQIGPEYAAVLIGTSTGGSGSFLTLHLVTRSAGAIVAGPGVLVGDRTRVEAFAIDPSGVRFDAGSVRLAVLTQGPTDPFCCPTQREARIYVRDNNAFRLASTTITQPGTGPNVAPAPPKTGTAGLADAGSNAAALLALATVILALGARSRMAAR